MCSSIPTSNVNLLQFAAAGFATAELDLDDETVLRWRGYIPPPQRREGGQGHLADATFFARYHYRWGQEDFILYTVVSAPCGRT
jgi:transitional endoplasmic reticulum ATPase